MNIYIKIEIKEREFLSRLVLGAYAALKGNEVFIGDDELLQLVENRKLNSGIILEKSIPPKIDRINQLKKYKKNKCIVTSIDEEGGLATIDYKNNFAPRRFSNKTLSYTDKVFCWGKYDYNLNIKLFPKYKKKFIITGNPRYDLLKEKFSSEFIKKKSKKKKIVIISSLMVYAIKNHPLANISSLNSKKVKDYLIDRFDYKKLISDKYLKLIDNLSKSFKDLLIEIWIHPKESLQKWKTIIPQNKNIKFVDNKKFLSSSINDIIYIHNGSLMALEALIKKKFVVSFQPFQSKFNNTLPDKLSKKVSSENEIILLLRKILKKKTKSFINSNKIEMLINNAYKNDSCHKIIRFWQKMDQKSLSKNNNLFNLKLKNRLRLIRQNINYKIYNNKFPPFTKKEINNIIKKILKVEPKFKNLRINLLGPKLIYIKKDD